MNSNTIATKIKARFDHAASKKLLKEKYESKMIFYFNDGMWKAGPDLISILNCVTNDNLVLLDMYDTPVKIDRVELHKKAVQVWQEQLNAWQVEHADNQQKR